MPTTIHGTNGITFNDGSTQNTRPAVGYRNRIINGDMRIWQRGTTISNPTTTSNFYTADRWGVNRGSDATGVTVSRDISGLSGFEYSLKLQRTAGNTSTQAIALWGSNESSNTVDLAGGQVTLSFWARAGSNYSGGLLLSQIITGTGTDQRVYAYTGLTGIATATITLTTTWTRYTITGTAGSSVTEVGEFFQWTPTGTAGADDSVYITGVQLEAGPTATDFERRPIGTELALCQRYYEVIISQLCHNTAWGTSYNQGFWKATKRVSPTITLANNSGGSGAVFSILSTNSVYQSTANSIIGTIDIRGDAEL
jgi:hypothetical protein